MTTKPSDPRELRGLAIFQEPNSVIQTGKSTWDIRAQSFDGYYTVTKTFIKGRNPGRMHEWSCTCPDHQTRHTVCKHIWAVKFSIAFKKEVEAKQNRVVLEPVELTACPDCGSENLKKAGIRHNKSGEIQRFACPDCGKRFSINIGFERMKHNPKAITAAMQLYFSGESLRNTQKSLKFLGTEVSHQTINNWIEKYTCLMKGYVDNLKPNVGDTWRADEIFMKIKGDLKYLFALMDDQTRYWIAQEVADTKHSHDASRLFRESKEIAGKKPEILITDGLRSYHDAFNKEFYTNSKPQSRHINAIKLTGDSNNNKMERINGEIRDREKTMRGLKTKETPILKGMQVYHNYIRPHEALDGKTPAEACGIELRGENKWMTLIQNAAAAK